MIVSAIQHAVNNGARIINMSIGSKTQNAAYEEAAAWARNLGSLLFAASGNNGTSELRYPAACPSAIAVGATKSDDQIWELSNFGAHLAYSAPGHEISSSYPNNNYAQLSGTSMACPHVAAVAALILSQNPGYSPEDVLAALNHGVQDLGTQGRDHYYGFGRINAEKSMTYRPSTGSLRLNQQTGPDLSALKSDFSSTSFVPGQLFLRPQSGISLAEILAATGLSPEEIRTIKTFEFSGLLLVSVPSGREIETGRILQNCNLVCYAELNSIISFD
jgi:hypothetical protein